MIDPQDVHDGAIEIKLPDLSRVALEEGDAILVRLRESLVSMAEAVGIERRIKEKLPGHEVLIVARDVEVAVLRPVSAPVAEPCGVELGEPCFLTVECGLPRGHQGNHYATCEW